MIYDFRKGDTAELLLDKLKAEFSDKSDFELDRINDIPKERVQYVGDSYIHRQGEHEYYMFAYLHRYASIQFSSLPKYHITECETREIYSGYRFSSRMPVKVYCIDQRKSLGKLRLELCKHCQRQINFLSLDTDDVKWFDIILKKAEERAYALEDLRMDGYTRDWNHVSKALRFKKGFICEKCGIDLSERRAEFFCEVHHVDGEKMNNKPSNLKCLCIQCHSNVDSNHKSNYSNGKNKLKLNQFKLQFGSVI